MGDAAGAFGGVPPGAPVHVSARLRSRVVLSVQARQRHARRRPGRADAYAISGLARRPCAASCRRRQPGPSRHRRRDDADDRGISRATGSRPARLPPLPTSASALRYWSGLAVPDQPAHPGRPSAKALAQLVERARHQCGPCRPADGAGHDARSAAGADWLAAGNRARSDDRYLAVLHPAPVRGQLLGAEVELGFPSGRSAGLVLLRPAAGVALAYRQHRLPSHPSFVEPDPELPAACLSRGQPVAAGRAPPFTPRQSALCTSGAVGQPERQAGLVPQHASGPERGDRREWKNLVSQPPREALH